MSIIYDQSTSRILMVTRRKHPKIWICEFAAGSAAPRTRLPATSSADATVPQGGVEPGESSGQAAIRESWEEGESQSCENNNHLLA